MIVWCPDHLKYLMWHEKGRCCEASPLFFGDSNPLAWMRNQPSSSSLSLTSPFLNKDFGMGYLPDLPDILDYTITHDEVTPRISNLFYLKLTFLKKCV